MVLLVLCKPFCYHAVSGTTDHACSDIPAMVTLYSPHGIRILPVLPVCCDSRWLFTATCYGGGRTHYQVVSSPQVGFISHTMPDTHVYLPNPHHACITG